MTGRKARGFTLIELLAAVFVLAVGLTSVSTLFVAGIISNHKAERTSAGVNAAQRELERLHSAGFSGCIVDAEVFGSDEGYTIIQQNADKTGQIGFGVPNQPLMTGVIDIAYYTGSTGVYPNLKNVTVTVTWTGGGLTAGNTVLNALIANRP
jgi:prepilin-type N-terminal cleavage/methylation domain-containing protein